jgi:hypothetical protein
MAWRIVFSGMQSHVWGAVAMAAVLLSMVVCVWLSRSEWKLVSRPVGLVLLFLRIAVLLVLLFVMLQPQLVWERTDDQVPQVILAVDVSGSMQSTDRHADPAELLEWSRALGLIGDELNDEDRQQLIDDWNRTVPSDVLASEESSERDAVMARRRHIRQMLADVGRLTRMQFARRLLSASPHELISKLQDEFDVKLLTFAVDERAVDEERMMELLDAEPVPPSANTDLAGALNHILTSGESEAPRIVVLLSDGRQTENGNAIDVAQQMANRDIRVYTVPIGSTHLPKDLIARPVDAPGSVFPDDKTTVHSTITAAGYNGQEVSIRLHHGSRLLEEMHVVVSDDRAEADFVLPTLPKGQHDLRIEVGILPGELSEENNEQEFSIAVVDNRAAVMLIDEEPRWEFRYLNNLFERDERIELTTVLLNQPFLEILNAPALPQQIPDVVQLEERLANTDLLLIGDVGIEGMAEDVWKVVSEAVEQDGLTVVMSPGRHRINETLSLPTVQELLPIELPRSILAEGFSATPVGGELASFRLVPQAAAVLLPMFQISADSTGPASTFGRLPGHPWILSGEPRAGATLWADAAIQTASGEKSFPLMAHHHFGAGQVIWMGMDSTWRWRRRAGDTWHHRFWGQMVRWAVRNKSASGNDDVRLMLSSDFIGEQQAVEVSARFSPVLTAQMTGSDVRVQVARVMESDSSKEIPPEFILLQSDPESPERFAAQLTGLPAGRYEVLLDESGLPFEFDDPIRTELAVLARATPELSDISCDRDYLERIATASGGQFLEPWELQGLPEMLLQTVSVSATVAQQQSLWDRWPTLAAFFFLLMGQWTVRKLCGLP